MKKVLFVCSRNRLRSPTAEQVFSVREDLEVASAGTDRDAETPLSSELIKWADVIVVMEKVHRTKVQRDYRKALDGKHIVCLDIPDIYALMDPGLVVLLQARMSRYLPHQPPRPMLDSSPRSDALDRSERSGHRLAD